MVWFSKFKFLYALKLNFNGGVNFKKKYQNFGYLKKLENFFDIELNWPMKWTEMLIGFGLFFIHKSGGWVSGWIGVKACLRIAYNKKTEIWRCEKRLLYTVIQLEKLFSAVTKLNLRCQYIVLRLDLYLLFLIRLMSNLKTKTFHMS